jgi:ribose transport system ATP-binding protein
MVAIARALQDQEGAGAGAVLVLDEPTASLPDPEVAQLHAALRRYAAAGQTILYVSHRLDEVLAVADRVSVLRDGRLVASEPTSGLTQDALVELILGRTIEPPSDAARVIDGDAVGLEVRGLVTGPLTGVDLVVRRGEIVGLAGLLGSGRTELLRAVFGAEPIDAGAVLVDGEPLDGGGPAAAMAKGVAYVPEDRAADATFAELGVRENLSAADLRRFWRRGRLRHAEEEAEAIDSIGRYLIRTPNGRPLMSTLSGGNQQKVVLARWLRRKPRGLLLGEPSQGVDAGARAEIHHLVKQAADEGAAVVVVSSDLEELISLCDRIAVLRGGRIVAEVPAAGTDAATLTRLAYAPTEVPA